MAWLYEKSATWRWIIRTSKQSPMWTAVFGVAFVGVPYVAGRLTLAGTNPEVINPEWEQKLKAKQSVDYQLLARANRERLAQLLKETQDRSGEARYQAALRGESLGTQSTGSSAGKYRGITEAKPD